MSATPDVIVPTEPVVSEPQGKPSVKPSERLMSLDALRGFDMLWIIGASVAAEELSKVVQTPLMRSVGTQFQHVRWEGFRFEDLVFPMFVFIVGVSLVFSLGKQLRTRGHGGAVKRILLRSLILYVLGIIYSGGLSHGLDSVRLFGVLQRIALCYLFTGLMFCFFRVRGLVAATVLLLVGYWALMTFVPVPGIEPHSFAERRNLANYIDAHYLPGHKYNGDHDPEGILSTLPAIASCLLGVFAGLLLKGDRVKPYSKVAILLLAGAASLGLGFAWGIQFPIIKKLWTSSFVLVAGGYSAILLGLFYLVLDVWKWRRWAAPFVWIGMNAIALYMIAGLADIEGIARRLVGGDVGQNVFQQYDAFAVSVVALLLMIAIARFLYVHKVFIRA